MGIFVDTAGFLAILNASDLSHQPARKAWEEILGSNTLLFTSNYVLVEAAALIQNRLGMEAVRVFQSDIVPILEITWVDEAVHKQGMSAFLAANRRSLSLVDCTSFEIMRHFGLEIVFTLDRHFSEQGFKLLPEQS